MLRSLVVKLLNRLDPPEKPVVRACPSCGESLAQQADALVEQGEFDYLVCDCGVPSIWRGRDLVVSDDTYAEGFDA